MTQDENAEADEAFETQRQSIKRGMKERASLAGASGWLRLFNALINPLLKAKQGVSGFVLWPRDYSGINKGWAGNIDEIPPPLTRFAPLLFSNEAEMSCWKKYVSMKPRLRDWAELMQEHTCIVHMLCMCRYKQSKWRDDATCMINHPRPLVAPA